MRGIGMVRSSRATLVAAVALGVGVGGVAFAAGGGGSPTITVCVHKHGGGLYKAKHCAKHDKQLSWSNVDPKQFLAAGAQTEFAFGQIREDASIRNSSPNVSSVDHPGAGQFCVNFSSLPSQNAIESAVVGHAGSSSSPYFIYVTNGQAAGFNCPNASSTNDPLQILIMDSSGNRQDARFSFIVP